MTKTKIIFAAMAIVFAPMLANSQTSPASPASVPAPPVYPPYGRNITLAEAKSVMAAAEKESIKNNWNMVITIVEPNGAMVLMQKMDGAQYGSGEVALKKAETAAKFRRPTSYFQTAVKNGTLNSIFTGAMAIEGGELIIIGDRIVGAIGVSGGSGAQDGLIARAAAESVK